MKHIRSWAASALFAALLTACGGGDPDVPGSGSPAGAPTAKGAFSAIVVFGSSESDMGTYAPATSLAGNGAAPYFGGKFTTNSTTGTVWVENLATQLGIVMTPAEVGFAGQSVKCPAAALAPNSCTNYAQGGSRVTNPIGNGNAGGALTVPIVTQIDNHLARFTSFKPSDLVFVVGGINDVLIAFQTFAAAATQIQTQAANGQITADQANNLLLAAQTEGQAAMKVAGIELAGYIRTKILAKGATYVGVVPVPDLASTPAGQSVPANARPVFTAMSDTFNLWVRDGLSGAPVKLLDSRELFNAVVAAPASFGFTNVSVPTCDATKISAITGGRVTDGSSLFCNSTVGAPYNGMRTGADPLTWFFADSVHPSTGGHKYFSDIVTRQLQAFGWI